MNALIAVLPTRLPVPMIAERGRCGDHLRRRRREAEVGPAVLGPEREGDRCELEALGRGQHRLVGKVDDRIRAEALERRRERLGG